MGAPKQVNQIDTIAFCSLNLLSVAKNDQPKESLSAMREIRDLKTSKSRPLPAGMDKRMFALAFFLLGLTLACASAQACTIEHNNANTITFKGECDQSALHAQLTAATRGLAPRDKASPEATTAAATALAPRAELRTPSGRPQKHKVAGREVFGASTPFFHRSNRDSR